MKQKILRCSALLLLLALLLCGCDSAPQQTDSASTGSGANTAGLEQQEVQTPEALTLETAQQYYRVQFADPRDMMYVTDAQTMETGAFLHGVRQEEDGLYIGSMEVLQIGQLIGSGGSIEEAVGLQAACHTQDENCYVISSQTAEEESPVLRIGSEPVPLDGLFSDEDTVRWLFPWDGGVLLLTNDGFFCPVSMDGSLGTVTALEFQPRHAFQGESGRIILVSREDVPAFYALEPGTISAERLCAVPQELEQASFLPGEKWGYDLLAYDDVSLYGWNFGDDTLLELLRFETLSLSGSRITAMACLDAGSLVGTFVPMDGSQTRVFFLSKSDTPAEKITLTIAGISQPMTMQNLMAEFGQMYPEYRAEFVDYRALYGDQAVTQLLLDLQDENCPDVLLLNAVPYEALAQRELLTDLNVYLSGGKTLKKEDLLPNLVEALESEDGKLYRLPQSFAIKTVVALASVVGERTTWDFDAFSEIAAQMPENCALFSDHDPDSILTDVLFHSYSHFVDEERGQATFDSPLFRSWLQLIRKLQDVPLPESESSEEALRNKEILLSRVQFSSAGQYDDLSKALGDDMVAIGYPDGAAASFYLSNPVAIPANAQETKAAWAFIELMVSSVYHNDRRGWLCPTDTMEASLEAEVAEGVRQESADALRALIDTTDQVVYYNEDVTQIVLEETAPYFGDAISLEEAVQRIQDRVQLYLDEL